MDARETLQRIANNETNELDINWRDYQQLVWWLVCQETEIGSGQIYVFEATNGEDEGVVDISVKLRMPPVRIFEDDPFQTDRQLFIECKRYKTTLTLDKVGKIFCHSILEQPDALWIVSPKRLSAQASDYAQRIFLTSNSGDRRPLLPRTKFRHWRLNDLIGRTVPSRRSIGLDIADWQFIQVTAYGRALVVSASSPPHSSVRRVDCYERTTYHLRLILDDPPASTGEVTVSLSFDEGGDLTKFVVPANQLRSKADILEVDIPLSQLSGKCLHGIGVQHALTGAERQIEFSPLRFSVFEPAVMDLRPYAARLLARRIANGDVTTRVICCAGAAGVGKSTLLERVAWALAREHGWDVRAHTITESTDGSLFFDLLQWFVLAVDEVSASIQGSNGSGLRNSIISTIAFRYSQLRTPEAVQTLIEAAAQGAVNDAQLQELARVLSRAAQDRGAPLLIVLRDVHLASGSIASALIRLLLRLRDEGWGNVRFIVEVRTDLIATGTPDLASQLSERLAGDFSRIDLEPLSLVELSKELNSRVICTNFGGIMRTLHKLTGGFPLFLDQLFRDLLSQDILVRDKLRIGSYSLDSNALVGLRLERVPSQISWFLRNRIAQVTNSTSRLMAMCLGIIAQVLRVAPEGAPRALISDLIDGAIANTLTEVDECLQVAINLGFLRSDDAGRSVIFVHDAMLIAARELARSEALFIRVAARIASGHSPPALLGPFRAHLLRARLAGEVGDSDSALALALRAEATATEAGNLVYRRLALESALETLSGNDRPNEEWVRQELAVRERLIWTVMQQASQRFAQLTIRSTEQRVSSLYVAGLITASERAVAAFHSARGRVVIATRSLDAPELFRALPVMCANAIDPAQIHYALTRLVIVAIETNNVPSALRGIDYCLRLPTVSNDRDALLSFLSEIGDVLAIERPGLELVVRERAYQLAEELLASNATDARTMAHVTVSLLIAKAGINAESVDEFEIESLREEYERKGFLNPLIRLINLSGAMAATREVDQQGADPLRVWSDCAELAGATNHQSIRWHVLNNLRNLQLRRGVSEAAKIWQSEADAIVVPYLQRRDELGAAIAQCLDHFSTVASFSAPPNEGILPVSLRELRTIKQMSPLMQQTKSNESWSLI